MTAIGSLTSSLNEATVEVIFMSPAQTCSLLLKKTENRKNFKTNNPQTEKMYYVVISTPVGKLLQIPKNTNEQRSV